MPPDGATQTFGSVGTVNNADTINNTTINNSIVQPAKQSRLELFRRLRQIDRHEESEELSDLIIDRPATAERPFIAGLIGVAEDGIPAFISRFGDFELEYELRLPCDYLGLMRWPERRFRSLVADLIAAIDRRRPGYVVGRAFEQGHLVDLVRGYGRSICFGHVLRPAACRANPQLLQEWLEFFARTCVNPAGGSQLVCLLSIEVCDPRTDDCEWLIGELRRLFATYGAPLLGPCGPVEPADVQDWIDAYNENPALEELMRIPSRIVAQVFADARSLRFETVQDRVVAALGLSQDGAQRGGYAE